MRLKNHIFQAEEGWIDRGLMSEDIETGTFDRPAAQSYEQRCLANHTPARDVDQVSIFADCIEYRGINQFFGRRTARYWGQYKICGESYAKVERSVNFMRRAGFFPETAAL